MKFLRDTLSMYVDGFRNMTVGRDLWLLIILKCIVIFAIVKVFFFPDVLQTNFRDDSSRAAEVRKSLAMPAENE